MLFVIFQMIHGNAEYPCCKCAVSPERGQVGNHFQQNVLGRILCIRKGAKHPKRQTEYHILHLGHKRFEGFFIPRCGLVNQSLQFFLRFFIHKILPPAILDHALLPV